MTKLHLSLLLLFVLPNFIFSQNGKDFSTVKTATGEVKIPGKWTPMNTADDSGQTYMQNEDKIIIAVAKNPKKAYEFFKSNKSDFENVKEFYKWDSDYRKQNNFKTDKLKENSKSEYIVWKYNDGKSDNVFLFGSLKDTFLNILVYTTTWSEDEKIKFLESVYQLNK